MGVYMNGTDGMYPMMITKKNMPASIDIISADQYSPTVPQYEANMARRLYEGQAEFRGGGVYPALAPHQSVMVVPGLFADATKPWNTSEALMLACLEGFWNWAQSDTRVSCNTTYTWLASRLAVCTRGTDTRSSLSIIYLLTRGTCRWSA